MMRRGHVAMVTLLISQAVEVVPGCADMVVRLPPPCFTSVSPGLGKEFRNGIGWTPLEKTARSGVCWLRDALAGTSIFFELVAAGDWVMKGSFRTAWAVLPLSSCSCSVRMGEARLSGHNLESGAGHCFLVCGGLSLP